MAEKTDPPIFKQIAGDPGHLFALDSSGRVWELLRDAKDERTWVRLDAKALVTE